MSSSQFFWIRLVQSWTRYKKAQPFNIWNNRKDSSIFRQLVAPSNFKRFNMKVSFGTLQKKTTTVGNFCNMFFCNTLLIKTFALYRPSIGKEWNGSKYKSKLRSGKIHTLTYIMYNIGATFFWYKYNIHKHASVSNFCTVSVHQNI